MLVLALLLDGCFCTWAGLIKTHGTNCSRLLCEKVWSLDQAWAVGTWVGFTSAESRRKALNLSLRCQRTGVVITILGHHHRRCFLIFPKTPIQSQLSWLEQVFFRLLSSYSLLKSWEEDKSITFCKILSQYNSMGSHIWHVSFFVWPPFWTLSWTRYWSEETLI